MKINEIHVKGRSPNKSKNYTRTGGNKQQYKWLIVFNNGKSKTVWADSRYNATHGQISPEQHIIGIKSAKKVKEAKLDETEKKRGERCKLCGVKRTKTTERESCHGRNYSTYGHSWRD